MSKCYSDPEPAYRIYIPRSGALPSVFLQSSQKKSTSADAKSLYKPGIYTSSIDLNENTFDLEVTVDSDRVTSIRLVNLSESTAAMFPLMEPALESLASQIYTSQSLENIQYSEDQKYTSMILLNAIETALKKAENN